MICKICGKDHEENRCYSAPPCPKCGNNRQVWINQISGKLTCHRAYCHTVIESADLEDQNQQIYKPDADPRDQVILELLSEVRMAKEALTKASRFIRSIYKADVVDELTCEDMDDTERSVGAALDYLNRN